MDYRTYLKNYPDENGRFGPYGGAYLSDELKQLLKKYQKHIKQYAILQNL